MSSPMKPWEGAGSNSRAPTPACCATQGTPYGNRPSALRNGVDATQTVKANPPPIPSRPQRPSTTYNSLTGYNSGMMGSYGYGSSMYGGYGSGMYGGYGSSLYGGYGGYGGGYDMYNRFGNYGNQTMGSSFVRRAEESSQAAFQSVESIVQAFGSISMMLESTHFAMLNTFRAVLGAADHFSRMKSHVLNAIGAIAIIRTLKTLCKKILYMLGLISNSGVENEVWSEVNSTASAVAAGSGIEKKNTKSWPIVMFFAVVLGVPWVIWKMLQSFVTEEDDSRAWMKGTGDHVLARVEYDFVGETEDELSVSAGSVIKVAPKDKQPRMRGWLLATADGEREGIVPANYVKILGLKRASNSKPAITPSSSDKALASSYSQNTQNSLPSNQEINASNTTTNEHEDPFESLDFTINDNNDLDSMENVPT